MSKKLIAALVTVLAVLLLAFTCPDKQKHQDEIRFSVSNYIDQKVDADADGWAMLGAMFADKIIDVFLDKHLKVNNYVIFSIGEIHYQGKTKMVSVGLLNRVFTASEDDIKRAVDRKGESGQEE